MLKTVREYLAQIVELLQSGSGSGYEVVGLKDTADVRINPATEDSLSSVRDSVAIPSAGGQGSVSLTSSSASALSSSAISCREVLVQADVGNAGNVYVGFSGVSSADGIVLTAGSGITLKIDDVSKVYAIADNDGDIVRYVYVV